MRTDAEHLELRGQALLDHMLDEHPDAVITHCTFGEIFDALAALHITIHAPCPGGAQRMIGLDYDMHADELSEAELAHVRAWLQRIGHAPPSDYWRRFELLDDAGLRLRVTRVVFAADGHVAVTETVDITVNEPPPVTRQWISR